MARLSSAAIALPAFASAWLAAVLLAPVLATWPAGKAIAALTYLLASVICHQQPARSFHIDGSQLPVCARCLGIYAGAAIGAMASVLFRSDASREPLAVWRILLIAAAVPTSLTLLAEWLSIVEPSNVARFTAALPLGIAGAWLVTNVMRGHLR